MISIIKAIRILKNNSGGTKAMLKLTYDTFNSVGSKETIKRIYRFIHRYGRTQQKKPAKHLLKNLRSWHENVLNSSADQFTSTQVAAIGTGPQGIGAIAFYLPQFHPFSENDTWWGVGFTEWRNVARALPQYIGHYQPRVPADLGYYDLRLISVLAAQAEMASKAGLSGFCFYYYWFAGKPLMETPIQLWEQTKTIDFPYCLCWANENWTRRWDGLDKEVLIAQSHSPEDDLSFIRHIAQYLRDSRYIKIDGKPLLLVYRASLLPSATATAARWRTFWREKYGEELYLACVHSIGTGGDKQHDSPELFGFDASVEFPPVGMAAKEIEVEHTAESFSGKVHDYKHMATTGKNFTPHSYAKFRGVMPSWDNSARRKSNGFIFHNSNPDTYRDWLHEALTYSRWFPQKTNTDLVFINAWNEWAEGAYLEPDLRYGFAYMNATAQALSAWKDTDLQCLCDQPVSAPVVVILHLHHVELAEEFRTALSQLNLDVWITINDCKHFNLVREAFPLARIYLLPNRGRDIAPFLALAPLLKKESYQLGLKLHSKRSLHRSDGDYWRKTLVNGLLPPNLDLKILLGVMDQHTDIGLISPEQHRLTIDGYRGTNDPLLARLSALSKIDIQSSETFVAGSMFWFRPAALATLFELPLLTGDFEFENAQVDGTLAHAIERFTGACARRDGYRILEMPEMMELIKNTN